MLIHRFQALKDSGWSAGFSLLGTTRNGKCSVSDFCRNRECAKRRILEHARQNPNASAKRCAWIVVAATARWRSLAEAYESANYPVRSSLLPHEFLAAHLENIGMTATKWGNLIGIDRSTASRLLRGERMFKTRHIRKTAEVLGFEVSLLI